MLVIGILISDCVMIYIDSDNKDNMIQYMKYINGILKNSPIPQFKLLYSNFKGDNLKDDFEKYCPDISKTEFISCKIGEGSFSKTYMNIREKFTEKQEKNFDSVYFQTKCSQ